MYGGRTHEIVGEGRDLLNPADHDIVDTLVLTLLEESVVDLACEDMSTSLLVYDRQIYAPVQRI